MKIYIEHNGCLNLALDYNVMLYALKQAQHELVQDSQNADVIIFAGCGVRSEWVSNAIRRINSLDIGHKEVIITGCIANIETERIRKMVNTNHLSFNNIKDIVNTFTLLDFDGLSRVFSQNETTNFMGDNPLRNKIGGKEKVLQFIQKLDKKYNTSAELFFKNNTSGYAFYHEDEPVEFIVAARGCPYRCTYCTIPKGRGAYESVKIESILYKVENAVRNHRYKIIIIGDELGNYGYDFKDGTNFKTLIDSVLMVDSRINISLRYIEPIPFIRYYDVIASYCYNKRISLIHLPIQSGAQSVLTAMNRNYNINKLIGLCEPLTKETSTIFCTNWLVGFPTESDIDFNMTIQAAKRLNFNLNTIIPYSPRPDTIAISLPQLNSESTIRFRRNTLEHIILEFKFAQLLKQIPPISTIEKEQLWELIQNAEDSPIKQL